MKNRSLLDAYHCYDADHTVLEFLCCSGSNESMIIFTAEKAQLFPHFNNTAL